MVSRASLDGLSVSVTAMACGHENLHEFWFQFSTPKAPIAFWIPGFDAQYTAQEWYDSPLELGATQC